MMLEMYGLLSLGMLLFAVLVHAWLSKCCRHQWEDVPEGRHKTDVTYYYPDFDRTTKQPQIYQEQKCLKCGSRKTVKILGER